jgi:phosphoglycerol transferase MdoB-like AlkP superfamily enzyme
MRQRLRLLASFVIFWISFQIIIRAIFLWYNHDLTSQLTASEVLLIFWHGFRMDLSLSGYPIMLTSLILTISVFTQSKWLYLSLNSLSIFMLLLFSIIVMVDLELYRHWGFRADTTPLFYAGSEAIGSVEISVVIKLLLILLALFVISLFVYSIWLIPKLAGLPPTSKKAFLPLLLATALMVIVIRGSFTVAPMNTGFVFFHKTKPYANHAAINVVWHFLYSLQSNNNIEYPTDFLDNQLAEKYFDSLYQQRDTTVHLFAVPKPNVVLFILESFTADIIEPLGGLPSITPNLNQLCSEGMLFDNCYASGDRTDKGIVAVLSGYPAQPLTSIIKYSPKTQKLPHLNHFMRDLGYNTSFVYGGDVNWANFRSYLTNGEFEHITSDEDFPNVKQSKWGVHDHIVFERALQQCDSAHKPFFKVILSLSSHEPFDVPMRTFITGEDEESMFLNACHYTDKSIGEFVTNARKSSWWNNTVIIFVADHGHRHPGNKELRDKKRFRIPLLMIGGAVRKDTVVHTFASQTDIANTLLGQLDKPSNKFRFSKNILSRSAKSFAAYFFNDGYGFVAPEEYIVYDNPGKQFLRKDGASEGDLTASKAYEQILYLDYNAK